MGVNINNLRRGDIESVQLPLPSPDELERLLHQQESSQESPWAKERREAASYSEKRCLSEFEVRAGGDAQGGRTLAELAVLALPVLDALQGESGNSGWVDVFELESRLDVVGVALDFNEPASVRGARLVLNDLQQLIEGLGEKGALHVDRLEMAIRRPPQATAVRERLEQEEEVRSALKKLSESRRRSTVS